MQGPNHLDLAKTLADEHLATTYDHHTSRPEGISNRVRNWAGRRLINTGERLTARPTELQLKVSTGPPCP